MAKAMPYDLLLDVLSRFPKGASLEEILLALGQTNSRRTVQRWLQELSKDQRVVAIGKARARRYKLPLTPTEVESAPLLIPVSKEGSEIQGNVSQPIQRRKRVGYHREFLEAYIPNKTFYLPVALQNKLAQLGKVEEGGYPGGTYAQHIFHRLLIDLSWNSSRLEGNTYSLLETEKLIDSGEAAEGKDLKETQMILNHKAAIEFLIASAREEGVSRYMVLNIHTLLSDNLLPDSASCGRLRLFPVGIEKSTYMPMGIPQVLSECFDLLVEKARHIKAPLEQAFFLMVHLPYLQPFEDVNKRTSRLAANIPLIQNDLAPLSFIDVPEIAYIHGLLGVYELNRIELLRDVFEWAYERSCSLYSVTRRELGEPDPFRMRHRSEIKQIVANIVRGKKDKTQAVRAIREWVAKNILEKDRKRFIETVERELQTLHEGNIARYQLRPAEYETWKRTWQ